MSIDLVYAVVIGCVIAYMAYIRNPKTKALVYSLPLPITVVLLASNLAVNASNIIGLALVIGFLWLTYYLHTIRRWHILAADICSVIMYVVIGYLAVKFISLGFFVTVGIYVICWLIYVLKYHHQPEQTTKSKSDALPPLAKGIGSAAIAFVILRLKEVLSGIVVTFPFSGVFAVIESQKSLKTQAHVVTRNSIAVLLLFVTLYVLPHTLPVLFRISAAWTIYLLALWIIYQVFERKNTQS